MGGEILGSGTRDGTVVVVKMTGAATVHQSNTSLSTLTQFANGSWRMNGLVMEKDSA